MEFITLTPAEVSGGQLAPATLAHAVQQVQKNGYVALANAVPIELVSRLNVDFLQAVDDAMRTDASKTEVNTSTFRKNRIRMDLPFRDPFIDPHILTNAYALPIVDKILGEDCRLFYFSADAPMPGSDYQTTHGDYSPFYPESDTVLPITGLVVNYPLIDVTPANGPLEAWPGTHVTAEKLYTGSHVQDEASKTSPVQMLTPKGSLIVRDVRMWHRGTPNVSDKIRPNLALIYGRSWWDTTGSVYPQASLGVTRPTFDGLSERAKKLLRFEKLI